MSDSPAREENRARNRAPAARQVYAPNGGGPITPGAHPQNTGGKPGRSGRPPSVLRELFRMKLGPRIGFLAKVIDGKVAGATVADRLRALELLARYALDSRLQGVDINDVRDRVAKTLDVFREVLPPELAMAVVERMRPIWRMGTQPGG